jgi:hypothetical protein
VISRLVPRPTPTLVVHHSPTPSEVRTAASSNGEGKKAEAAWLRWCSVNSSLPSQRSAPGIPARASRSTPFWNSFSRSQTGTASLNERKPRGANAR